MLERDDRLVVSELSRLGRSLGQIMGLLDRLVKQGSAVIAIKVPDRQASRQLDRGSWPIFSKSGRMTPLTIQGFSGMPRSQSDTDGIPRQSSRTCRSPMNRTGSRRPSAFTISFPKMITHRIFRNCDDGALCVTGVARELSRHRANHVFPGNLPDFRRNSARNFPHDAPRGPFQMSLCSSRIRSI